MESQWLDLANRLDFESSFEEARSLKNFLMVDSGSNALYMVTSELQLVVNYSSIIYLGFSAQAVLFAA